MTTQIGYAVIEYDLQGRATSARFEPTLQVSYDPNLERQLKAIRHPKDEETIRTNAQRVLGAWFNKVTEVELADRETHEIVAENIRCEKYDNGAIKKCTLQFILKQKEHAH
jgi:hypothetical protein